MSVIIITTKGEITIDLYVKKCPKTVQNFLSLCKIKYYNNCLFFNIQKDFLIQSKLIKQLITINSVAGDPMNNGKGGECVYSLLDRNGKKKYFDDEFHPSIKHNKYGLVSMANLGEKNTNGSQFFITMSKNHLNYLDNKNTVFGEVVDERNDVKNEEEEEEVSSSSRGYETLRKINECMCDKNGKPFQVIRIKKVIVLDDPFEPLENIEKITPPKSPKPIYEFEGMIGENEELESENIQNSKEKEEFLLKKEEKSRKMVLEMVEDLPSYDIEPPKNVLFVCKLNPVTSDEDLEIIFSRFAPVKSCEIIRDKRTGESLCYGFVEFESQDICEQVYLKMQNVIIDDRLIKCDFSQSVSKLWKNYAKSKNQEGLKMNNKSNSSKNDSGAKRKRKESPPKQQKRMKIDNNETRNYDRDGRRSFKDMRKRSPRRNERYDRRNRDWNRSLSPENNVRQGGRRRRRSRSPRRSYETNRRKNDSRDRYRRRSRSPDFRNRGRR